MYCLECHDTYPDTARFCSTCGERLCASPPAASDALPLSAQSLAAEPSDASEPEPTEILAPWVPEGNARPESGDIALFEAPAAAWGQCDSSVFTFTSDADDVGAWTAESASEAEPDEPIASETWLPTIALPEPAWEPGLALCAADAQNPMENVGPADSPGVSGAPMLESWWVPSAPQWTNHSAPHPAAFAASAVSNPALSLASSGGQALALESWWVPQSNVALAVAEAVQAPQLTIVSRGIPEPEANIVWQHEPVPDHSILADPAQPDDHESGVNETRGVVPDSTEAPAEVPAEASPITLADPGHLNSSWLGPEIDPPDPSSLPQPWWIPKPETNDEHDGEDEHDPVEAASLWTTPAVASPLGHEQPELPAVSAPLPAEPPTADAGIARGNAVAAPAKPESTPPRGRVIYPRPPASAGGRQKQKVPMPSVRPAFLLAAVVAIILGGLYIWLSAAFETPAAGRLPEPLPVNPLVQDIGVPSPPPLPSEAGVTTAPPAEPTPPPVTTSTTVVAPAAPVRRANRTPATRTPRTVAQAPPQRPVEPPVKTEPVVVQHLPASALPTQTAMAAPPAQPAPPPQVEVVSGQVFEASSVDVKPAIARQIEPRYPEGIAEQQDDVVVLRVLVTPNGRTADTQVLRKSKVDPLLDAAAVRAVQQWTFSPALKRDRAVACWINVGVPFRAVRDVASR